MTTKLQYPETILEFQQWFKSEQDCETYLFKSRWPDGFECPICGDWDYYYVESRRAFKCKANGHFTYLTAGTIMEDTRQPLLLWFWAAYLVATHKNGISAYQLQKQLGLKRYEPAFNMLHKFRASMVNPGREKLKGKVEVDEAFVGGPSTGGKKQGRGTDKAIVIVAVEDKGGHAGRIRLRHIPYVREDTVKKFIQDSVNPGSLVITDGFKSYRKLPDWGYRHKFTIGSRTDEPILPLAHIIVSNMKSLFKGVYHGVSKKHLQAYLNEYVFRFNRRNYPMSGFRTLLGLTSKVEWPTQDELYSGEWKHPNPKNGGK